MTKALVLASGLTFVLSSASFAGSLKALDDTDVINMESFSEAHEIALSRVAVDDVVALPSPVPLPAAGWMLLAGIGGIVALRRRAKA